MKKLLSLTLAVLIIFSMATMAVFAASPKPLERDDNNIIKFDHLDFNPKSNALWAKQNDEGKWECFIQAGTMTYPQDESWKTIAPYITSAYRTGTEFSFVEGGEVLRFEILDASENTTPGLKFVVNEFHDQEVPVGTESGTNPKAEYVKIRVKNYSMSDRFTFGFTTNNTGGGYGFVTMTVSDLKVDKDNKEYQSASGEWETYIFSMAAINQATNYNDGLSKDSDGNPISRWGGYVGDIIFFPFGFEVEDGPGPYNGAKIDIDYFVMGSLDYVTNYKSDLEIKEESITKLELVKAPTKQNYYVGEELDLTGLELKATFNDGTKEWTETLTTASTPESVMSKASDSYAVKLSVGQKDVTYNVKVTGVSSVEVIDTTPEDTTYELSEVSEKFNADGYEFKVTYADNNTITYGPSAVNCFGDFSTVGDKTVTANFFGTDVTFNVKVVNVTGLEITTDKTYRYGDEVKEDDLTINLIFSDGSKISEDDAATSLSYTITMNKGVAGEVTGTVQGINSDYGVDVTGEVKVNYEMPVSIKIESDPTKMSYEPGESFSEEGMKVALVYADGKTKTITSDEFSTRVDTSAPGDKRVTVKCDIAGLEDLDLEGEKLVIKVEGEVATSSNTTAATTTANQGGSSSGISPVVIIIIVVVVLAIVGVVVFLVIKKKK